MAKIVASVNVSHVPAIGAAWDNKKSQEPYWKPLFDGFDFSKKWIADLKPDVIILVYNDHASAFRCEHHSDVRARAARRSSRRRTRAGARARCRRSSVTRRSRATSRSR